MKTHNQGPKRPFRVLAGAFLMVSQAVGADQAKSEKSLGPDVAQEQAGFFVQEPSLRAYIEEAAERNPSIQEALARYQAALEKAPRVSGLPDLRFGFNQAIRSVETRVGPQVNSFALTQAFPWFGTLELREKVALTEAAAWKQLYFARQREVVARVKKAYYGLGYVDAAVRIAEEDRSLLEHYEGLAQTRYATGQGLQQAVIKVQAEITKVTNRLKILNQQRVSMAASLNTLMDRRPHDSLSRVELVGPPNVPLNLEELFELGEANRQELKAAAAMIERGEQSIE